jgi:hypothetical protein
MVARRPAILQRLQTAAADGIRTVVIAPADVYGAGAGIPAMLRCAPTTGGSEPTLLYVGNGKLHARQRRAQRLRNYLAAVSRRHDENLAA